MENTNNNIEKPEVETNIEEHSIANVNQFVILSIVSFGLYELWWFYKSWRFFKEKEKSDIMPAWRAIFSIIFLIPLLKKTNELAQEKGYGQSYDPILLFIGFLGFNFLSRLPDPYWLISIFSFAFLVQPFRALNYAMLNSEEFNIKEQVSYNKNQIIILLTGTMFWIFVLIALTVKE